NGTLQSTYITPGGAGSVNNSQCTIAASNFSVGHSGNNASVTATIAFANTFASKNNIYLRGIDSANATSGWVTEGTWSRGGNQAPTVVSVSPNSGSGSPQAFTFTWSDPDGWADLKYEYALFNTSVSATNACYFVYEPTVNRLYLYNDNGTLQSSSITPGGAGSVNNSQCSIAASSLSVGHSGNNASVTATIAFANTFTGRNNIYLRGIDSANATSGWVTEGTWSRGGNQAPTVV